MQFIQTNKKQFHKETLKLCNTDENGQPKNASLETVGCVYNRYRLVHRWVPEMVLNVQSDSLIGYIQDCKTIFYDKTNKIFLFSLFLVSMRLRLRELSLVCVPFFLCGEGKKAPHRKKKAHTAFFPSQPMLLKSKILT